MEINPWTQNTSTVRTMRRQSRSNSSKTTNHYAKTIIVIQLINSVIPSDPAKMLYEHPMKTIVVIQLINYVIPSDPAKMLHEHLMTVAPSDASHFFLFFVSHIFIP